MLAVAERLSQAVQTAAQVFERGLVGRIAPEERGQFAPLLPAFRAEREIGEKHAFALAEARHSLAAGKQAQLEAAQKPKRPARPALIARSRSRIHSRLT